MKPQKQPSWFAPHADAMPEREQQDRQREHDVGRARDHGVDLAPVEAGREAEQHADHEGDAGREERDREGRRARRTRSARRGHGPVSSTPRSTPGGAFASGSGPPRWGPRGGRTRRATSGSPGWARGPDQLAISGAKIAIRIIRMMITTPASANRSLRKWRQKISQGLRPMIDAGVSADGARLQVGAFVDLALFDLGDVGVRVGTTHARTGILETSQGPAIHRPRDRHRRSRFEGQGCESAGHRYFTIRANASGSRLAPPTSAPSISGVRHELPDVPRLHAPAVLDADPRAHVSADAARRAWPGSAPRPGPRRSVRRCVPVPIAQIGS